MNEQSSQLRILTALLVVVIALAAGLFFYIPSTQQANTIIPPDNPQNPPATAKHEKIRDAEISLDPSLYFTQTFGGSGSETIVDTFYEDGKLYIFGNTTSTDYDFNSAGGFLAIVSENGKTIGFASYKGTLKAVTLYNGGFVMALDRDKVPVALAVDYMGDEIKSVTIPIVRDEETLDIKYVDGGYLFITALIQSFTGFTRLKMTLLNQSLEPTSTVVTDETYSLEYIDTLDIMGEYTLMANALSDIRNMLCFGTWGKKLAHYPMDFSYKVLGFWIVGYFYYLAQTSTSTLLIKEGGTVIELAGLCNNPTIVGDLDCMYISAGNSFFCVSDDKVVFSAEYGPTSFYEDEYIYAVSNNNGRLSVRSFVDGKKIHESTFSYAMTNATILTCPGGMFVIGNTSGKFGESDITIAKVNYTL